MLSNTCSSDGSGGMRRTEGESVAILPWVGQSNGHTNQHHLNEIINQSLSSYFKNECKTYHDQVMTKRHFFNFCCKKKKTVLCRRGWVEDNSLSVRPKLYLYAKEARVGKGFRVSQATLVLPFMKVKVDNARVRYDGILRYARHLRLLD